jgi:hypothetical protein
MRIRYLSLAAREYFAAQDFYDNTEEGDSEALEAEIEQALRPAREGMLPGVRIREVSPTLDLRKVTLVGTYPYALILGVRPHEVVVIAVAHGERKPEYWSRRVKKVEPNLPPTV